MIKKIAFVIICLALGAAIACGFTLALGLTE
jgi:hypothetical protein